MSWTITCPNGHTNGASDVLRETATESEDDANVSFTSYRMECPDCEETEWL